MGWGAPGGFFEETGVPLEKEDVEDEVKGKRTKVEECSYEAPILSNSELRTQALGFRGIRGARLT